MFEAHFQTFEEPETGVALTSRLSAFREELTKRNLTGFVVPRADQQQNEYVPPSEERLAWLTGFTGSAGMAIVLAREVLVTELRNLSREHTERGDLLLTSRRHHDDLARLCDDLVAFLFRQLHGSEALNVLHQFLLGFLPLLAQPCFFCVS